MIKGHCWRAVRSAGFVVLLISAQRAAGQANGIYADFSTSMGSFTCRLEYAIAPKAVSSFIGLATGSRSWLDLNTGKARTNAFYNGLTFHRVISNFVIQAGSPNGQGTDGPGYAFPDEISSTLRFSGTGVLAMANSGTNSNGSQFFVTASPQTQLNNGYTIFGELAGGTNVVLAINKVAVDGNDKPLTNVYIQSVGIRRIGTAALAFDINAHNLPVVTNLPLKISKNGAQISLNLSNRLYADNQLYSSTDLKEWTSEGLGIEISAPTTNNFYRPITGPDQFYSLAQIRYQSTTFAPKTVNGRTLTLNFSGGSGTIVVSFNSSGGGTYTYTGNPPGTVTSYSWIQEPYRGRLPIQYSGLVPMSLLINFRSTTNGIFNGTAQTSPSASPVSGTWTMN